MNRLTDHWKQKISPMNRLTDHWKQKISPMNRLTDHRHRIIGSSDHRNLCPPLVIYCKKNTMGITARIELRSKGHDLFFLQEIGLSDPCSGKVAPGFL